MSEIDPESADAELTVGAVAREIRQRLEALGLAGVKTLPRSQGVATHPPAVVSTRTGGEPAVEEPAREVPAPTKAPAVEIRPPTPSASAQTPIPRPSAPAAHSPVATPFKPSPAVAPTSLPVVASLFGERGFDSELVPAADRPELLRVLAAEVAACRKCSELASTRTQTVFADGSPSARLMFIGEAPGADEDRTGVPFVGRAGQLLTDMITKGMGLKRQDVYIANNLKCRPPGNRDPQPDESANCRSYLERQIEIVRPEFICVLGRIAAQNLLETTLSMGTLRRKWHRYRGIPVIATYHPAYLLRNPSSKKDSWEDLQMLMTAMGLSVPSRKRPEG